MAKVSFARHLYRFFPGLEGREVHVQAANVAQVLSELEKQYPGIALYITDERGSLRQHVNIFVGEEMVVDRKALSDRLKEDSHVYIMQALSGG